MAAEDWGPAQWALHYIQEGFSARKGLEEFRAQGGHIANATWFKLTGELQAMLAQREGILDEPHNAVPTATQIQTWTTQKATGFIQQVEVLARDRATGEIMSIPYSHMSSDLKTRREVLADALSVYSDDNAERYNQSILGAVYTGTYQAVPEGA